MPFYLEDLTVNDSNLEVGEEKRFDIKMGSNWAKLRSVKIIQLIGGVMSLTFEIWETIGRATSTWAASTSYSLENRVLPATPDNFTYECSVAGISDSSEPTWPTTEGETVTDGTVIWTCHASYDPLDRSTLYRRILRRSLMQTEEQGAEYLEIIAPELLYRDRNKLGEVHCRLINNFGGTPSDFAVVLKLGEIGEAI